MTDPRACWAPAPLRPVVPLALVREFVYEYAAVSPQDGALDFMTAEKMNTESMNRFLAQVRNAHPDDFLIMILDGALSPQSQRAEYSGKDAPDPFATLLSGTESGRATLEYSPPRLFCKSCL